MTQGFFHPSYLAQSKQPIPLLPRCGACGLCNDCISPKMPVSGQGRKGILVIAEAPGRNEDEQGVQLVGEAGQWLRGALAQMDVDLDLDCWKTNAIICFVNPKVRIYTTEGYKQIRNVQVGDMVLTHKGRFRKVLSRSADLPLELRRNTEPLVLLKYGKRSITVTYTHELLTSGGWRQAGTLKAGDIVRALGAKCVVCGTVYFKDPGAYDTAESTCSPLCHNKAVGKRSGPAISRSMKSQYASGARDRYAATAACRNVVKRLAAAGEWNPAANRTEENKTIGYTKSAYKKERHNGFYVSKTVGIGEQEVAAYLQKNGIDYYHQYAVGTKNFDFYLPGYGVLLEVENPITWYKGRKQKRYREQCEADRYVARDALAEKCGVRLVYLRTEDPVSEVVRLLKNDNHAYYLADTKLKEVRIFKQTRQVYLYCLEVEEDHSYIGLGLVSHNCRPADNRTPTEAEIGHCRPNVIKAMKMLQPKMILPLGGAAVSSLMGWLWPDEALGMTRWAGWQIPSQQLNAWICPTYHPSYVKREERNPQVAAWTRRHLKEAVGLQGRPWAGIPDYAKQIEPIYDLNKAAAVIREMIARGGPVAFDYETDRLKPDGPGAYIYCCSVCWRGRRTIAFPWHGPVITAMRELVESPLPKIASNMKFEERWSRVGLGVGVNGWAWDTMLAAHEADNRTEIASIKFQAIIHLGQPAWDRHIKPYLKSSDDSGINCISRDVAMGDLLVYCGMDSLMEYLVAVSQGYIYDG